MATGLRATANSETSFDLTWSIPLEDGGTTVTGYRIEVSTVGSRSEMVAEVATAGTVPDFASATAVGHSDWASSHQKRILPWLTRPAMPSASSPVRAWWTVECCSPRRLPSPPSR